VATPFFYEQKESFNALKTNNFLNFVDLLTFLTLPFETFPKPIYSFNRAKRGLSLPVRRRKIVRRESLDEGAPALRYP
jgi:hypothetical protein